MPSDPELAACFSDELNFADYVAPSILRLGAALSFTSGRLAGSSFLKVALEDAKYFSWLNANGPASRTYASARGWWQAYSALPDSERSVWGSSVLLQVGCI